MTDRGNRVLWVLVGLVLLAVGGAGLSVGLGAWGAGAPTYLVDPIVVRWWRDGRWMSFASLAFIGLVLMLLGLKLAHAELRRRGRARLDDFDPSGPARLVPAGLEAAGLEAVAGHRTTSEPGLLSRGTTIVRAGPLNAALASDLRGIDGVRHAVVGLFGRPGELELRARLDIGDEVELAVLSANFEKVLERFTLTAGMSPSVVEVTLSVVAEVEDRVR